MGDNMSFTFGILESAPDNTIINSIYEYINSVCQFFQGNKDENENSLTNRLCILLNSRKPKEYPFYFHHQNLEDPSNNTSTDFASFATHPYASKNNVDEFTALIKFEAKRLSSNLPASREREYVRGEYNNNIRLKNSGGIERFKNGTHGRDIKYGGFIGYLQTGTKDDWFRKINELIWEQINVSSDKDLNWDSNDLIKAPTVDSNDYYTSLSSRKDNEPIQFRHYWVICGN